MKEIDNQLDKKLNDEICMQKMHNKYNQLDLDQAPKEKKTRRESPACTEGCLIRLQDECLGKFKVDINTYKRERAQAAAPDGLATYEEYISKNGWDSAVNSILFRQIHS
jgi:hypothetical protein